MAFARYFLAALATMTTSVCAEGTKKSMTLAHYADKLSELSGKRITVNGYLADFAPDLILLENENTNIFAKPSIIVSDLELHEFYVDHLEFVDAADYLSTQGCVNKYVELQGEVGFHPAHKVYSIISIEKIMTFSDSSYSQKVAICYSEN